MRKMTKLINLTNHPSAAWSAEQREAALNLADEIVDLPFPQVDPTATEAQVFRLACETVDQLLGHEHVTYVLIQGEFTLTYALVELLRRHAVCLAATTERVVALEGDKKVSTFRFVRFREYSA